MKIIHALYSVILDALFPVPASEQAALELGPEGAWQILPRALPPRAARMCSVFAYKDERVSRIIWAIKYKKSRVCTAIAAYSLHEVVESFRTALPAGMPVVLVPMPITRARRRERGFNQCELILEEICRLDREHHISRVHNLLVRVRHTSRQTMKNREERLQSAGNGLFEINAATAFRLRTVLTENRAAGVFIVVIDDVITTGSTMKAALDVLSGAGFADICGLSFAH